MLKKYWQDLSQRPGFWAMTATTTAIGFLMHHGKPDTLITFPGGCLVYDFLRYAWETRRKGKQP